MLQDVVQEGGSGGTESGKFVAILLNVSTHINIPFLFLPCPLSLSSLRTSFVERDAVTLKGNGLSVSAYNQKERTFAYLFMTLLNPVSGSLSCV